MSISPKLVVSEIHPEELPRAAELLGRAYRDNPLTLALLGEDPEVRWRTNEAVFGMRIASMQPVPLVVRDGGRVVGACGFDSPGGSKITQDDMVRVMAAWTAVGPDVPRKAMEMLADWRTKTPAEPHWNLGPVGVDPEYHGRGIGSAMVAAFCEMMDAEGANAFLETDLEKNANLYTKFGFETIHHAPSLGVPMWFMLRRPQA